MNWRQRLFDYANIAASSMLVACGVFLTIAHVFGKFEHWTKAIPAITLGVVSFVVFHLLLERIAQRSVLKAVQGLEEKVTCGVRYLGTAEDAEREMIRAVMQAEKRLLAIGGKSKRSDYLKAVSKVVLKAKKAKGSTFEYLRLLEGTYITEEMFEHLRPLLTEQDPERRVRVYWTPREKYTNLLVTEHHTVLAFSKPKREDYTALSLAGTDYAGEFSEYFHLAVEEAGGLEVTSADVLEAMCRRGNAPAPTVDEIKRLISLQA